MNLLFRLITSRAALAFALLPAFVAGCGGGLDPILGTPGIGVVPLTYSSRAMVVITTPAPGVADVSTNTQITATFSEAMAPATISDTSLLVTNTTVGSAVNGTVSYSASARTAAFTPTGGLLAANTEAERRVEVEVTGTR